MAPIGPIVRNPDPASAQASALKRLHSFLTQEQRPWRLSQWNLAATLTLRFLSVYAGGLWLRTRAVPSPTVPMRVSDLGSNLRIEWDPAQKAVHTASAATLEIRGGGRAPVAIPITRSGLDNGSALYVPQSDMIEVHLKLMHGSGPTSESVIYFINPSSPTAPPAAMLPAEAAPTVSPRASDAIPQTQPAGPVRRVGSLKSDRRPITRNPPRKHFVCRWAER